MEETALASGDFLNYTDLEYESHQEGTPADTICVSDMMTMDTATSQNWTAGTTQPTTHTFHFMNPR